MISKEEYVKGIYGENDNSIARTKTEIDLIKKFIKIAIKSIDYEFIVNFDGSNLYKMFYIRALCKANKLSYKVIDGTESRYSAVIHTLNSHSEGVIINEIYT